MVIWLYMAGVKGGEACQREDMEDTALSPSELLYQIKQAEEPLSPDQPNHITSSAQCTVQDDMVGGGVATTRTTLGFRASTCSGCSEAYMDFPSTRADLMIHGDTGPG